MTDRPIKAVLDPSAVAAYAAGSISVGELLAEIADEHAAVAVPDVCLVEAAARYPEGAWLAFDVLLGLPHCVTLPVPHWRDTAPLVGRLGLSRAVTLVWAASCGAHLLTVDGDRYTGYDHISIIEV